MDRGFGVTGTLDTGIVRELAPLLESLGYRTLWINDVPEGDSLARCAAAIDVTARLRVATGVIPIDRRGPQDIVADVVRRGIPADRLTIGVGSGMAPHALDRVRSAVADLRRLADPSTSISVGALGPKMTALAATVSDDVLLNWLTPAAARVSSTEVREVAVNAGRPTPRVTAYVRVATAPEAIDRLVSEAERYGAYPSYAAHFRRFGVEPVDTTIGSTDAATVVRRLKTYTGTVDEIVVRAITAAETFESYRDLALLTAPEGS
jgi:alkanesulfonate monooxygenase SsuD/methylene tetrahydromethanopterin reductase-like flavin-dependent oxidoreductase (luciferase family)